MTVKELELWENMEMVHRYAGAFTSQGIMKFFKSPFT
jgi:hypothetical protein